MDIIATELKTQNEMTCDEVFGFFLIFIYRFVSIEFFKEICFLAIAYWYMANIEGWELYLKINDGVQNPLGVFTEVENAEILPDLINIFCIKYFIPLMST